MSDFMKRRDSGTSGGRRISNTRGPREVAGSQILGGCNSKMKIVSTDYTNPNPNPKTLTTITLTLTLRPSRLFKEIFVLKFKPVKLCQRTRYRAYIEICV